MEQKKPNILTGAIVGLLMTAPLIAVFYLADVLAGLPFVPFDLFDWFGRNLPGDVLTIGIDTMVDAIIALNLGETSSAAKTIEQIIGLSMMMGVGIVAGGLLYFILPRVQSAYPVGIGLGLFIGVIMALISASVNLTATTGPVVSAVWIVSAFVVWGAGLAWVYTDLLKITPASAEGEASVQQVGRREFLVRIGAATATLTVIGAGLGAVLNTRTDETTTTTTGTEGEALVQAPNLEGGLEPAPGTRPEYTPLEDHYRIDISSRPPRIEEEEWRMDVNGLVAAPLAISLADLRDNYDPVDQFVTMSCISNRLGGTLISTTRWTGIPLHLLLDDWNLDDSATHLKVTAADNFDEWVEIDLIRRDERVMLAYAWDGQPLTSENGFPLRIYIPDHYGMKMPKWITGIEVTDAWGEGYWVRRGWSEQALVRTTSVVDTVAVDNIVTAEDGAMLIPVGGIAYSGAKGISKVEVQVNEGEWLEAQLRTPLSETTWVIWRYDWPFEAGEHTFRVRTYDAAGMMQIIETNGVRPDGATGIHSRNARVQDSA